MATVVPDWTVVGHVVEYVVTAMAALYAAYLRSKSEGGKPPTAPAAVPQAPDFSAFNTLSAMAMSQLNELRTELDEARRDLEMSYTTAEEQRVKFYNFVHRYRERHPDDDLILEDVELLRDLGVGIRSSQQAAVAHIEQASQKVDQARGVIARLPDDGTKDGGA